MDGVHCFRSGWKNCYARNCAPDRHIRNAVSLGEWRMSLNSPHLHRLASFRCSSSDPNYEIASVGAPNTNYSGYAVYGDYSN
jgi:hypothetical protein